MRWIVYWIGCCIIGYSVVLGLTQQNSYIVAPYNALIEWCTPRSDELTPLLPLDLFPEHKLLEAQAPLIRDEILAYLAQYQPPTATETSSLTFQPSFADSGWRLVLLKFYNKEYPIIQSHFSHTMRCLQQCGSRVRLAMFSLLLPYHRIAPHVGPFRGSMRYHLGLQIPRDRSQCLLAVYDTPIVYTHHWEFGRSVLFDDTYVHEVINNTPEPRIVLFLDIQRDSPSLTPIMAQLNHWVCHSFFIHWLSQLNDQNEIPQKISNSNK